MEKNFEWNEERVIELFQFVSPTSVQIPYATDVKKWIEQFKKSKQVKRDYEVLEFRTREDLGKIIWILNNGRYTDNRYKLLSWTFDEMLGYAGTGRSVKEGTIVINSVLRLTDGEVFSLKDVCEQGEIKEFKHSDWSNQITVIFKSDSGIVERYLRDVKKAAKPDYEIRSFRDINSEKEFFTRTMDGLFTSQFVSIAFTEEQLLSRGFPIYSVKRPSDGQIFSIGDIAGNTINDSIFQITKIDISAGEAYLMTVGRLLPLRNAKKETPKQKLFTTEDGVDVFKGQMFYEVWLYDWSILAGSTQSDKSHLHHYKYFSTKETAEEYVTQNKPITICLKDFIQSLKVPSNDTLADIEMVFKQKINL